MPRNIDHEPIPIPQRVQEMKDRLHHALETNELTQEHLLGKLDQHFWIGGDLEAFINSDFSPATLTLHGLNRVCEAIAISVASMLASLDGDTRPLPFRIPGPTEQWHLGQHIGERLSAARRTKGLTQKQLAEDLGHDDRVYIENVEDGWIEPTILDLFIWNDLLGLTMADLIGDLAEIWEQRAKDEKGSMKRTTAVPVGVQGLPLGEERQGDLAVRVWYRSELGDDPRAWVLVIVKYDGDDFDTPAQDELDPDEWELVIMLANRLIDRVRKDPNTDLELPSVGLQL